MADPRNLNDLIVPMGLPKLPDAIFTNYVYKAIPLAFDESESYYELCSQLLYYIRDVIIPTVNKNAEALQELQVYVTELDKKVEDYYKTLDTKIDETRKDLEDLIENVRAILQQEIETETKERKDADKVLTDNLNNEISQRKADVQALTTNKFDKKSAREFAIVNINNKFYLSDFNHFYYQKLSNDILYKPHTKNNNIKYLGNNLFLVVSDFVNADGTFKKQISVDIIRYNETLNNFTGVSQNVLNMDFSPTKEGYTPSIFEYADPLDNGELHYYILYSCVKDDELNYVATTRAYELLINVEQNYSVSLGTGILEFNNAVMYLTHAKLVKVPSETDINTNEYYMIGFNKKPETLPNDTEFLYPNQSVFIRGTYKGTQTPQVKIIDEIQDYIYNATMLPSTPTYNIDNVDDSYYNIFCIGTQQNNKKVKLILLSMNHTKLDEIFFNVTYQTEKEIGFNNQGIIAQFDYINNEQEINLINNLFYGLNCSFYPAINTKVQEQLTQLQTNITAEETARINEDKNINAHLTATEQATNSTFNQFSQSLNNVTKSITDETKAREDADKDINAHLTSTENMFNSTISSLGTQVNTNTKNIAKNSEDIKALQEGGSGSTTDLTEVNQKIETNTTKINNIINNNICSIGFTSNSGVDDDGRGYSYIDGIIYSYDNINWYSKKINSFTTISDNLDTNAYYIEYNNKGYIIFIKGGRTTHNAEMDLWIYDNLNNTPKHVKFKSTENSDYKEWHIFKPYAKIINNELYIIATYQIYDPNWGQYERTIYYCDFHCNFNEILNAENNHTFIMDKDKFISINSNNTSFTSPIIISAIHGLGAHNLVECDIQVYDTYNNALSNFSIKRIDNHNINTTTITPINNYLPLYGIISDNYRLNNLSNNKVDIIDKNYNSLINIQPFIYNNNIQPFNFNNVTNINDKNFIINNYNVLSNNTLIFTFNINYPNTIKLSPTDYNNWLSNQFTLQHNETLANGQFHALSILNGKLTYMHIAIENITTNEINNNGTTIYKICDFANNSYLYNYNFNDLDIGLLYKTNDTYQQIYIYNHGIYAKSPITSSSGDLVFNIGNYPNNVPTLKI